MPGPGCNKRHPIGDKFNRYYSFSAQPFCRCRQWTHKKWRFPHIFVHLKTNLPAVEAGYLTSDLEYYYLRILFPVKKSLYLVFERLLEELCSQTHPSTAFLQNPAKLYVGLHVQQYTPVSGFFATKSTIL